MKSHIIRGVSHVKILRTTLYIGRSTMKHAEGNENMKSLIQLFSLCFLKEHAQLQTQVQHYLLPAEIHVTTMIY